MQNRLSFIYNFDMFQLIASYWCCTKKTTGDLRSLETSFSCSGLWWLCPGWDTSPLQGIRHVYLFTARVASPPTSMHLCGGRNKVCIRMKKRNCLWSPEEKLKLLSREGIAICQMLFFYWFKILTKSSLN